MENSMALTINHIIKLDSTVNISAYIDEEFDVGTLLDITDSLAYSHFEEEINSKEILSSNMGTDGVRTNYQILLEHRGSVGIWYHNEYRGIRLTQA
jgi:hypothetical protein